jgi:hypothetical protein
MLPVAGTCSTMNKITLLVVWGFGLFSLGNIIYPLFYAFPKAKKLQRENKLKKPIPLYTILVAPLIWSILLVGSILLVLKYFPSYRIAYFISLGLILIVIIYQIPNKNKDLEIDFKET